MHEGLRDRKYVCLKDTYLFPLQKIVVNKRQETLKTHMTDFCRRKSHLFSLLGKELTQFLFFLNSSMILLFNKHPRILSQLLPVFKKDLTILQGIILTNYKLLFA